MRIIFNDQISISNIFKLLFSKKKKVLFSAFIGFLIGLIIAILTPDYYESGTSLLPQKASGIPKIGGSLSGLAGLAGIDLGSISSNDQLSPENYVNVLKSREYKLALLESKAFFDSTNITIKEYLTEYKSVDPVMFMINLPRMLIKAFKPDMEMVEASKDTIFISKSTELMFEYLDESLSIEFDPEYDILIIRGSFQTPEIVYHIVKFTQQYIIQYVSEYSIYRQKRSLNFLKESLETKKKELDVMQGRLAKFYDNNRNITAKYAELELRLLESQYDLIFGVYSSLVAEIHSAEIGLLKEEAVVKIINPVFYPLEKTGPSKSKYCIIFTLLSVVFFSSLLVADAILKDLKKGNHSE